MDKFLLAENPMRPDSTGLFIISRLYPRCLIQAICVNDEGIDHNLSAIFDLFTHINGDDVPEQWQLVVCDFFDHVADSVPKDSVKDYRQMLKRAWRWYKSYLEWEDNNIDSQ